MTRRACTERPAARPVRQHQRAHAPASRVASLPARAAEPLLAIEPIEILVPQRRSWQDNGWLQLGALGLVFSLALGGAAAIGAARDDSPASASSDTAPWGEGVCLAGTVQDLQTGAIVEDPERGDC